MDLVPGDAQYNLDVVGAVICLVTVQVMDQFALF